MVRVVDIGRWRWSEKWVVIIGGGDAGCWWLDWVVITTQEFDVKYSKILQLLPFIEN
jgi:hypothetical protein